MRIEDADIFVEFRPGRWPAETLVYRSGSGQTEARLVPVYLTSSETRYELRIYDRASTPAHRATLLAEATNSAWIHDAPIVRYPEPDPDGMQDPQLVAVITV